MFSRYFLKSIQSALLLFQHEWTDDTATPCLAAPKIQPMLDAQSATDILLKRETVRQVLEARGVLEYWQRFPDNFYGDRGLYGDGSAYFRSCMRKLLKAATKTAELPAAVNNTDVPEFNPVRLKICDAIPSSYMPSHTPPRVNSLVAVHLTDDRRAELNLSDEFMNFEPLIARVARVVDDETFECSWLESQPVRGEVVPDGLPEGYNGRWQDWLPPDDEEPMTVLNLSDIYAANFKLYPGSRKMCGPLKTILRAALSIFKAELEDRRDAEEVEQMLHDMERLSL